MIISEININACIVFQEPLNSEDDVTDDDPTDLFDTDNVVVCQYDKVCTSYNDNFFCLLIKLFHS